MTIQRTVGEVISNVEILWNGDSIEAIIEVVFKRIELFKVKIGVSYDIMIAKYGLLSLHDNQCKITMA